MNRENFHSTRIISKKCILPKHSSEIKNLLCKIAEENDINIHDAALCLSEIISKVNNIEDLNI